MGSNQAKFSKPFLGQFNCWTHCCAKERKSINHGVLVACMLGILPCRAQQSYRTLRCMHAWQPTQECTHVSQRGEKAPSRLQPSVIVITPPPVSSTTIALQGKSIGLAPDPITRLVSSSPQGPPHGSSNSSKTKVTGPLERTGRGRLPRPISKPAPLGFQPKSTPRRRPPPRR
jgi:hypothetical protein